MAVPASQSLERLSRLLANDALVAGLRPVQWEALRYLAKANRFSRTPKALTAYLGTTKGTVSQTVQALEKKGLVAKRRASGDQRVVKLELTKTAHPVLENDPLSKVQAVVDQLGRTELFHVEEGLETIILGLLEQRGGRPFGICRSCSHFRSADTSGESHCALLNVSLTREDAGKICAEQEPV
ncbi:MAG: MarR family transcriptional regulator [Erythrobacter sp.]|jgi:DNA-binding MarR family transcriptional regulator|nr:MarR family transcriptional regulator [Erythrobacter sp.]|tara:strand:+ start:7503 stop:8051 length:549 start_codon:yes stop_codon:yes gene_type:complete